MIRPFLQGAPHALRAVNQRAATPAYNGAWKRLLTTKTTSQAASKSAKPTPSQAWWRTSGPIQTTWRRLGYGGSSYTAAQNALRSGSKRGFRFSAWRGSQNGAKPAEETLSLTGRLKKLSREYGWSAVGVYFGLSILDFPFCFLFVRLVGAEKIGKVEHYVVSNVKAMVPEQMRQKATEYWMWLKGVETKETGRDDITDKLEMVGWGVEEAQERNDEYASLATQLALAYAIHKSFIFIRVPLTAAITPKVVKTLRGWGWNIGKRTRRG